jgi:tripeptide aminopeptidase
MDTVEPGRGIRPQLEAGRITSDGTTILGADNKSAVAACLEAVRFLKASCPRHGDVELLFTWGEERGHQGAKAFDISRVSARIGFVLDGEGPLGTIITRAPYYDSIRAVFLGRAAHSGIAPESGINAIVMASRAITRMTLGRVDERTTANIGTISGGSGRNTVPSRVEVEGEARSMAHESLKTQVRDMQMVMEDSARELGGKLQVEIKREYNGFQIGNDEAPVKIAETASRSVGLSPVITSTNGGSDGNEFNDRGIQTIVLGMGGHDYHSTRESMTVSQLVKLAEMISALVVESGR